MPSSPALRLAGVYDADGTLRGEVSYVVGHLLGQRECSLCDITHGMVRRKPLFDRLAADLGTPFDLLHRDEVHAAQREAIGELPCVLVDRGAGWTQLLGPAELRTCDGDPHALFALLAERLADGEAATPLAGSADGTGN